VSIQTLETRTIGKLKFWVAPSPVEEMIRERAEEKHLVVSDAVNDGKFTYELLTDPVVLPKGAREWICYLEGYDVQYLIAHEKPVEVNISDDTIKIIMMIAAIPFIIPLAAIALYAVLLTIGAVLIFGALALFVACGGVGICLTSDPVLIAVYRDSKGEMRWTSLWRWYGRS
jgi:hypothetical protein